MLPASDHTKIAVIVAGGMGTRMGADKPKQFLELQGKSILQRTTETFLNSYSDMRVILVLPQDHLEEGKKLLAGSPDRERILFAVGGETRFHSVRNGLEWVEGPSIVFIHDAVRCLLTVDLIRRCYDQAIRVGSAIPAIAATDSIRLVGDDSSVSVPRNKVRLIQTPQTFRSEVILSAYRAEYQEHFTDEASVVEFSGQPVHLIEGETHNLKITGPTDLITAEQYLRLFADPI